MEVYVFKETNDVINPVNTTTVIRTSHFDLEDTGLGNNLNTLEDIVNYPTDYEQII